MNRKLVGGAVAAVIAAIAIWLLFGRGGKEPVKVATDVPRSADVQVKPLETPKAQPEQAAPRGMAPRWSLDVDPAGPLPLEGQVVGADGKGVGGAKVWLGSVPPRSTTSEEDGSFSFSKLVGRTYHLTASSGKQLGSVTYKLTEKSDPVVIRISEGASIVVTVIDDDGKPIEGAEVKEDEEPTARTDATGKATLEPIKPGWVSILATATGYAPNSAFTTLGSAGASGQLTVTLHKGFAVSGKVLDETGKPIAKAKVEPQGVMWDFGGARATEVVTDDKGEFTIPALAAGSHVLTAVDGEHAPTQSAPVTVNDRPVTGIVITMKAGARLAGKVVDRDHKPVAFATVRVASKSRAAWMMASRQTTTDKEGAFELSGLARAPLIKLISPHKLIAFVFVSC